MDVVRPKYLTGARARPQRSPMPHNSEPPPILQYFKWEHLPPHLQPTSKACAELAEQMVRECAPGHELSAGLRKLLEAKDCFVRAKLPRA